MVRHHATGLSRGQCLWRLTSVIWIFTSDAWCRWHWSWNWSWGDWNWWCNWRWWWHWSRNYFHWCHLLNRRRWFEQRRLLSRRYWCDGYDGRLWHSIHLLVSCEIWTGKNKCETKTDIREKCACKIDNNIDLDQWFSMKKIMEFFREKMGSVSLCLMDREDNIYILFVYDWFSFELQPPSHYFHSPNRCHFRLSDL